MPQMKWRDFFFKVLMPKKHLMNEKDLSLPQRGGIITLFPQTLRVFIDKCAEAQRALGFENEKDHPEVAPAQFELNYSYADALIGADQIQLYKLVCRQIARTMGMTASFLPKPMVGINGSGMHTNLSIAKKGKNIFHDKKGKGELSAFAWSFIEKILSTLPRLMSLCIMNTISSLV